MYIESISPSDAYIMSHHYYTTDRAKTFLFCYRTTISQCPMEFYEDPYVSYLKSAVLSEKGWFKYSLLHLHPSKRYNWIGSSLICVISCWLFSGKPLSKSTSSTTVTSQSQAMLENLWHLTWTLTAICLCNLGPMDIRLFNHVRATNAVITNKKYKAFNTQGNTLHWLCITNLYDMINDNFVTSCYDNFKAFVKS